MDAVGHLVKRCSRGKIYPGLAGKTGESNKQSAVELLGFYCHTAANLAGPAVRQWNNFIDGAPAMAPLLFPNLGLLAGLGLWTLNMHLPPRDEA